MKLFYLAQALKILKPPACPEPSPMDRHLCRMDNTRTLRKLFYGELAAGSRPVGRPKLRFKDNLKSILKSGTLNILNT